MRLLHEDELSLILSLSGKQEESLDIRIADEIRSYLDEWRMSTFLEELSNSKLIEIDSVRIDYKNGGFMDGFLNSFSKLIIKDKTKEAIKLAIGSGFEGLAKTLKSVKTLSEMDKIIEDVLKGHSILRGGDFVEVKGVRYL
jgi:hypothetical protein